MLSYLLDDSGGGVRIEANVVLKTMVLAAFNDFQPEPFQLTSSTTPEEWQLCITFLLAAPLLLHQPGPAVQALDQRTPLLIAYFPFCQHVHEACDDIPQQSMHSPHLWMGRMLCTTFNDD